MNINANKLIERAKRIAKNFSENGIAVGTRSKKHAARYSAAKAKAKSKTRVAAA